MCRTELHRNRITTDSRSNEFANPANPADHCGHDASINLSGPRIPSVGGWKANSDPLGTRKTHATSKFTIRVAK